MDKVLPEIEEPHKLRHVDTVDHSKPVIDPGEAATMAMVQWSRVFQPVTYSRWCACHCIPTV